MCSQCFALTVQIEVALRCCASSVLAEMILCAVRHREMLLLCLMGVKGLVILSCVRASSQDEFCSTKFGFWPAMPTLLEPLEPDVSGTHLPSWGQQVSELQGTGRAVGSWSSSGYFSQNLD